MDHKLSDLPELLSSKRQILVMIGGADPVNMDVPMDEFRKSPQVFVDWLSGVLSKPRAPDASHLFVAGLAEQGKLLRAYTLNVDGMERDAGIPKGLVRHVRGTLEEAFCDTCKRPLNVIKARREWRKKIVSVCGVCPGVAKPGMLFIGDQVAENYYSNITQDFAKCDCLLVLGMGVKLDIFEKIVCLVPPKVTRIFVNETKVDVEALMQSEIVGVETSLKRLDNERARLVTALERLKLDTSDRDVHILGSLKLSE